MQVTSHRFANHSKPSEKSKTEQEHEDDLLVRIPDDEELDSHFRMFNRPEVLELINEVGDIEHPVPLGMTLLRKVPEFRSWQ